MGIVDSVHVNRAARTEAAPEAARTPAKRRKGQTLMLIARVVGELVATQKHASHEGRKLLLVQPLNLDGSNRGDAVVALDAVDAGRRRPGPAGHRGIQRDDCGGPAQFTD